MSHRPVPKLLLLRMCRRRSATRSEVVRYDADGWGTPSLAPRHPVSASVGVSRLVLERVRYCCKLDVGAFEGTETIS